MVSLDFGTAGQKLTRRSCEFPGFSAPRRGLSWIHALLVAGYCLFLFLENSPATVCLFRITDDEILVGADSFFETDGIEQAPKAVKIHQLGAMFFTIQGKTRIGETRLVDLVNRTKMSAGWEKESSEFAPLFQGLLSRWLIETSKTRPDLYEPYALDGVVVTSLQLFGFRQGRPFMDTLEFVTENKGTSVAIRTQHVKFPTGKPAWIPAGCWTQGNPVKDFIVTNDAVARMKFLFNREFLAPAPPGQAKVARPPLDILRVTSSGARWIQKKPECPEILPYKPSSGSVVFSSVR